MIHLLNYRKQVWYSFVLLLTLTLSLSTSTHPAFAATLQHSQAKPVKNVQTITPPVSNDMLHNPGEGWVLYGAPAAQTANTLAYASVGYQRYDWSELEPKEGKYNWQSIDAPMNAWRTVGKKFAFGVMNANSSDAGLAYVTPAWVFKDGAAFTEASIYNPASGRKVIQYIPVWNDPIFLRKVQDFVRALAARYDGNMSIAFIDIRSYGNWGTMSTTAFPRSAALSTKDAQKHLTMYRQAFKRTQLLVPYGNAAYTSLYSWAVGQQIGLRDDGLMGRSTGSELTLAYGRAPAAMELYASYQWLNQKKYWSNARLLSALKNAKLSYLSMGSWGNDAQVMAAQQPQLLQTVANTIGYRFVLKSAALPITINNKEANTIRFSWMNQGVAFLYQPAQLAVALLNNSNSVVAKLWLVRENPQTWVPGRTTTTSDSITFTRIKAGTYKLAVGLFLHTSDSDPIYQLGNQGRTSQGWYILGRISVKR